MINERFTLTIVDDYGYIVDHIEHKTYFLRSDTVKKEVCEILNEMSHKITELEEELDYLKNNCIIIEKSESDENHEYKNCSECGYYDIEYEEVMAFGEYTTLTNISCGAGHDMDMDENGYYANECPDYWYDSSF